MITLQSGCDRELAINTLSGNVNSPVWCDREQDRLAMNTLLRGNDYSLVWVLEGTCNYYTLKRK